MAVKIQKNQDKKRKKNTKNKNWEICFVMSKYSYIKNLKDEDFRLLTGVKKVTFNLMLKYLKEAQEKFLDIFEKKKRQKKKPKRIQKKRPRQNLL